MTDVLEAVNAAFNALFYGAGAWFGLLLILSICLGLMLKWKYSGVLFLPVTIFLGIDYLTYDPPLPWHALIIWSSSLFLLLYMVKQLK
jgi:hypothetical protein